MQNRAASARDALPPESFTSFGDCLRFLRRRARLTQRELAIAVGYSPEHVSRLESNTRRPDPATVRALFAPALHLTNEPRLLESLLRLSHVPVDTEAARPAARRRLPPTLTPLVGRSAELEQIRARLARADCRLLSLIGLGGTGKTRLAIAAASHLQFRDGVVWVSLESLTDAAQILGALHEALELSPGQDVINFVAERELLVILDNAEHLVTDLDVISDLLAAAPKIKILVTSRERLQRYGEWVLDLGGLAADSDRVALFALTVARHQAHTTIESEADQAAASQIGAAVGGLPLAIELAASWVRTMPVTEVARRIRERPGALASSSQEQPRRHRSVEAVVAASWELLSPTEQDTMMVASVFRGGIDSEAARLVDPDWPMTHVGLVDRSLLTVGADQRLDLHPLVRGYATEQAGAVGILETLRRRHADHFRRWIVAAVPHLQDSGQRTWLPRLEIEHDNLRAALTCYVDLGDAAPATELCLALSDFWSIHGHHAEGRERVRAVLDLTPPVDQRRRLLNVLGELAWIQGDYDEARALLIEALPLHQAAGDDEATGAAQHRLGSIAGYEGDYDEAERLYRATLETKARVGDEVSTAKTLTNLAITTMRQGDNERAEVLHQQALTAFQAHQHEHFSAISLTNLGDLAIERADADAAENYYTDALQILFELGDQQRMAFPLDGLGRAALLHDRPDRAVRLWGAAEALRARFGTIVPPAERADYERALAQARASLPAAGYEQGWREGELLSAAETVAYAIAEA